MRRIFLFWRPRPQQAAEAWRLTPEQHRQVLELISQIGLRIVHDARGPVPLITFGRRVLEQLQTDRQLFAVPLPQFADALKKVIRDMEHERLRVLSPTDFIGVGYVYNAMDRETWPIVSSH
jgi:hypothetical protein